MGEFSGEEISWGWKEKFSYGGTFQEVGNFPGGIFFGGILQGDFTGEVLIEPSQVVNFIKNVQMQITRYSFT